MQCETVNVDLELQILILNAESVNKEKKLGATMTSSHKIRF